MHDSNIVNVSSLCIQIPGQIVIEESSQSTVTPRQSSTTNVNHKTVI